MKAFTTGPFTGRHAAILLVAFFAVVIAVNVLMARLASSTFGGVVVENSYVASQHYNRWLGEAAQEQALGWSAKVSRLPDNRVAVTLSGAPAIAVRLAAVARHPLGHLPDRTLEFLVQSDGSYVSQQSLPAGRWRLRLEAVAGAQRWRQELDLP